MDAMVSVEHGLVDNSASVPLMVVENGCGSPCIDFRQVSSELAAAARDADLVRNSNIFNETTRDHFLPCHLDDCL